MSRTFPRAEGVRPEKCVSRMMRVTGLAATEKFLPKGGEHSSAAPCRGKAARGGNRWKTTYDTATLVSKENAQETSEPSSFEVWSGLFRRPKLLFVWGPALRCLPSGR